MTQYLGWRWMNWVALILSAIALVFSLIMRESYAPILLQKKAARLRKETDDPRWWCRYDQKQSLVEVLKLNLSRPFVMAVTEPIWYDHHSLYELSKANTPPQYLLEPLYWHHIWYSIPLFRSIPNRLPRHSRVVPRSLRASILRDRNRVLDHRRLRAANSGHDQQSQTRSRNRKTDAGSHGVNSMHQRHFNPRR